MIGAALALGERSVDVLVRAVFDKLGLPPEPDDHHRVRAVLGYLGPTVRRLISPGLPTRPRPGMIGCRDIDGEAA